MSIFPSLHELPLSLNTLLAAGGNADAPNTALIKNDAVIFGILMIILAIIFKTSSLKYRFVRTFYKIVPMLLLCYFLPSLLTTFGVVSSDHSKLYHVASRYLLPASLILLTLSIDFKEILKLGPKAIIMFLTGTLGVMIGGPLAILATSAVAPDVVGGRGPSEVWRGFSTVAGSWIGGGANQTAMYEIYKPKGERILLIHEDPEMLNAIELALGEQYEYRFAKDAATAEQQASDFRPDILIVSKTHPDNNDYRLCEQFRKEKRIPTIIALAPKIENQTELLTDIKASEEAGASGYLSTPLDKKLTRDGTQAAIEKEYDKIYSIMITVDVIVAEIWMVFLLLGVGKAKEIDALFKADASAIEELQQKMEKFSLATSRVPTTVDYMMLAAICFGLTAIAHFAGDILGPRIGEKFPELKKFSLDSKFFWLIVIATTFGLGLSFTPVRNYEGVGASKIGTVFIFILVATIGMKMDIKAIASNPGLFLVGGIWMLIHVGLMFLVGWLIRAPYFYLAVGSKANIGGAASAPVVAAAFHPSLAPVGVLLAVLGYAVGTYGAWICAIMMRAVAPET